MSSPSQATNTAVIPCINDYLGDDTLLAVFQTGQKEQKFQVVREVCKYWKQLFDSHVSIQLSACRNVLTKTIFPFPESLKNASAIQNAFLDFKLFNQKLLGSIALPVTSRLLITSREDLQQIQQEYRQSLISFWDALKKQVFVFDEKMPETAEEISKWLYNENNQFQLLNIAEFDLTCPLITILPKELSLLQNLKKLSLNGISAQRLPSSITTLNQLEILEVKNMPLCELPQGLSQMDSLKYLMLESTQIRQLPEDIKNKPNLKTILFSNKNELFSVLKPIARVRRTELSKSPVESFKDEANVSMHISKFHNAPPKDKMEMHQLNASTT